MFGRSHTALDYKKQEIEISSLPNKVNSPYRSN